jgi:hypothetical protein
MRLLHDDRTNVRDQMAVTLNRRGMDPITLTLHALPSDYADEAEREIPSPRPERLGVLKDRKGRLEKDERGRPVIQYAEDKPEYLAALQEAQQLQAIKMIADALDPAEVEFGVQKNGQLPKQYYEAVRREMVAFGFSVGDLVELVKAVAEVSNLREEDLEGAMPDFFAKESSRLGSSSTKSAPGSGGTTQTGQDYRKRKGRAGSPSTS